MLQRLHRPGQLLDGGVLRLAGHARAQAARAHKVQQRPAVSQRARALPRRRRRVPPRPARAAGPPAAHRRRAGRVPPRPPARTRCTPSSSTPTAAARCCSRHKSSRRRVAPLLLAGGRGGALVRAGGQRVTEHRAPTRPLRSPSSDSARVTVPASDDTTSSKSRGAAHRARAGIARRVQRLWRAQAGCTREGGWALCRRAKRAVTGGAHTNRGGAHKRAVDAAHSLGEHARTRLLSLQQGCNNERSGTAGGSAATGAP